MNRYGTEGRSLKGWRCLGVMREHGMCRCPQAEHNPGMRWWYAFVSHTQQRAGSPCHHHKWRQGRECNTTVFNEARYVLWSDLTVQTGYLRKGHTVSDHAVTALWLSRVAEAITWLWKKKTAQSKDLPKYLGLETTYWNPHQSVCQLLFQLR